MIYLRVIIVFFALLVLFYYISVICQIFGISNFTDKEIKFNKAIIPFYYWL